MEKDGRRVHRIDHPRARLLEVAGELQALWDVEEEE
jgi:hypothetical protein